MKKAFPRATTILITGSPATEWRALLSGGVIRSAIVKPFELRDLQRAVSAGRTSRSLAGERGLRAASDERELGRD
jgi:hypothetical protein